MQLAKDYGFKPRACRPYRAKTKGKVERFNGYLKRSFITPLAASLKQVGLELDVATANGQIGAWLADVANQRVHGTTGAKPQDLLIEERGSLLALPYRPSVEAKPALGRIAQSMPRESLQHPLALYDQLLGGMA